MKSKISYFCYAKARSHTLSMDFMGSIYNFKHNHKNFTNCEHIVPRSRFINYNSLKVLKYDLHNLYPCCIYLNSQRKNHKYTEFNYANTFERPKFHFIPPDYAKGKIARTCLYLIQLYPDVKDTIHQNVIDKNLIIDWHLEYQPDDNELKREWLIGKIQGNINPLVLNPEKIECMDIF